MSFCSGWPKTMQNTETVDAMTHLNDIMTALAAPAPSRLVLPEYRQIELYTKRKTLAFAADEARADPAVPRVAALCRTFMTLDAFLAARTPFAEGQTSWVRYSALPRATMTDKIVAELYRMLRVARLVAFHPHGHIETNDGIIKINGAVNRVALTLEMTPAGVTLLESAVTYYLETLHQPYPSAYIDAMLAQYFTDLTAETRRFADEDRILYQFRQPFAFNRHFRFDCDNPKIRLGDGNLEIEIGTRHRDPAVYPIDFYVTIGNALHIIPVEALKNGRLSLADLPKWCARTPDGITLPAAFRQRFGREVMVAGQPMT